uniref:Uncharacterized protein n=1 Tax=Physcomitrium patens TaxID=3218 RepID=A0A2K1L055_PHYPA|nr:hypothetical protein PHYPA_002198 [Physcomitrium patens]
MRTVVCTEWVEVASVFQAGRAHGRVEDVDCFKRERAAVASDCVNVDLFPDTSSIRVLETYTALFRATRMRGWFRKALR